jgi:hypothetical protein
MKLEVIGLPYTRVVDILPKLTIAKTRRWGANLFSILRKQRLYCMNV